MLSAGCTMTTSPPLPSSRGWANFRRAFSCLLYFVFPFPGTSPRQCCLLPHLFRRPACIGVVLPLANNPQKSAPPPRVYQHAAATSVGWTAQGKPFHRAPDPPAPPAPEVPDPIAEDAAAAAATVTVTAPAPPLPQQPDTLVPGNADLPSGDDPVRPTSDGELDGDLDEHAVAVDPEHKDDAPQLTGEDPPTQMYSSDVPGQLELLDQAALLARRVCPIPL